MSIIKTVLVAASLVAAIATANATTSRAELESGYHGNTPVQGSRAR